MWPIWLSFWGRFDLGPIWLWTIWPGADLTGNPVECGLSQGLAQFKKIFHIFIYMLYIAYINNENLQTCLCFSIFLVILPAAASGTHMQNLKYTNLRWSSSEQLGTHTTYIPQYQLSYWNATNTKLVKFREKVNKNMHHLPI